MRSSLAAAAGACAVYAGLLVWLTWPLAAHLTTHLPLTHKLGNADARYAAWVLAYETHALATAPARLLDANIYHPTPRALFYGPTAFGTLPWFAPAFLASGNPTLALNLTFLGGVTLTALTLHLVVLGWTGSQLAAFVAGWTLCTNRWVLWNLPLVPQYAPLLYLPLIVRLAATPALGCRGLLCLAGLVALQCLTDPLYVGGAVLAPLGVIVLGRLARRATRAAGLRMAGAIGAALLALVPVYAGYLAVSRANPGLAEQSAWARFAPLPPVLPWAVLGGPAAVSPAALALVAGGAVVFAWRARRGRPTQPRRAWGYGALFAVVGVFLALPPETSWLEYSRPITLPQTLLARWTPIYDSLRATQRLGIPAAIALALLAGVGFAECVRVRSAAGRCVLALALAWAMYGGYQGGLGARWLDRLPLPAAYPLVATPGPDSLFGSILRRSDGPVLYLPIGRHGVTPTLHTEAMFHSIFHWRPLLNGYSSYWPAGFPERMALALRLPEATAVAALRRETGLAAIVLRMPERPTFGFRPWSDLAGRGGRKDILLVARSGNDLLFAVTDAGRSLPPARRGP
jgi:hypothetical protein